MDRIKNSRAASFAAIAAVYIASGAAGIAVYKSLALPWYLSLLIADAAATVVTFVFSVIFDNASVYDPYWSVQPIFIIICFAVGKEITLARALLAGAVFIWGIRLTANWAYTFHGLKYQDWRYSMLKEKTGAFYPLINFIGIHMVPTLIVYGCVIPAVYAFKNDARFSVWSVVFFCVSVGSVVLQGTADLQMHRYRKNRDAPFCRHGLWKYSRHPNYLGEILMWWGVALSVISAFPDKWYLAAGALANTVLFFAVSIPMADDRQSKKPDFGKYKTATRMLLPIKK